MIVNSVSINSNKGHSFGNRSRIEQFAGLADEDLKQLAYNKASIDVEDKKHKKINNILYYSIPLVSGVAAAVKSPATRVGRIANFGLGFASWAIPFAIVDAAIGAKHAAQKTIPTVKEFTEKHPVLTTIGTLAATIAAYVGLTRGGVKVLGKHGESISKAAAPYVEKLGNKLNNSKILDKLSDFTKKLPSSAKDVTKIALDWAPWMLLFANISHSFNHEKVKAQEYVNNYETLKEQQQIVRQNLAAEE